MISKFSLYDFIAAVVPGIFFLWALGALVQIRALQLAVPLVGGIAETSVLIVVGYVVGLLLQGVSQYVTEHALLSWWGGFPSARWLLPADSRFTPRFRQELSEALRAKFGIQLRVEVAEEARREDALKRAQEIFYRCYRSVEKLSDLPQTFNAQYGLFRALLTTFALLVIIIGGKVLWSHFWGRRVDLWTAAVGGACALGVIVSYWRITKRADDFAKAVYDVFLANYGSSK